jgi:tRNA A-37 threonylcarbamoyl transferase component Bud32
MLTHLLIVCIVLLAVFFVVGLIVKAVEKEQKARRPAAQLLSSQCPVCGTDLASDSPMGLCPKCLLQCGLSRAEKTPEPDEPPGTAAYQGPTSAPAAAELAATFPQLEITELIGQGGMGAVYKARQTKLDRMVAVKILPAEWGRDPAFAERFAREARALARLSHPHIVAVHDFGEAGGLFYLVMELVDGANLRQLIQAGRLAPEQALHIVPQICEALQYAHQEGIVHRDIKPENILIDKRGQVKIADFGLAKLMHRSAAEFTLTGSRQVMGTIDYMAPEQRTSPQDVDHRADIYSLGVVLYEMLTGELPLGRFAAPSDRARVDGRLDDVVFRALEQEPGRRYQRVSEIKSDVEAIAGFEPAQATGGSGRHDPFDLDLARTQLKVKGPAAGLVITALTIPVQGALWLGLLLEKNGELDERFWFLIAAAALAVCVVSWIIIRGAMCLAKMESYGMVMVAIILAMLPFSFHVIIGFFVGAFCLTCLSAPDVREAFARNQLRGRRQRRKATGGVGSRVRSALGGMLTLLVHRPTAPVVSRLASSDQQAAVAPVSQPTPVPQARTTDVQTKAFWWAHWTYVMGFGAFVLVLLAVALTIGSYLSSERANDGGVAQWKRDPSLAYHRGDLDLLQTYGNQRTAVETIFRTADQEYLKLEALHTKYDHDLTSDLVVTITPFQTELKALEDRVWSQLQGIFVNDFAMQRAKLLLPIRGSLFPYGAKQIKIALNWTNDGGYRWCLLSPEADEHATRAYERGRQIPQEYVRFWAVAGTKR